MVGGCCFAFLVSLCLFSVCFHQYFILVVVTTLSCHFLFSLIFHYSLAVVMVNHCWSSYGFAFCFGSIVLFHSYYNDVMVDGCCFSYGICFFFWFIILVCYCDCFDVLWLLAMGDGCCSSSGFAFFGYFIFAVMTMLSHLFSFVFIVLSLLFYYDDVMFDGCCSLYGICFSLFGLLLLFCVHSSFILVVVSSLFCSWCG